MAMSASCLSRTCFLERVQGFEIPCFACLHHGCGHLHDTRLPKMEKACTSTIIRYHLAASVFCEALRPLDSLGDRFDIHILASFRHLDATEDWL